MGLTTSIHLDANVLIEAVESEATAGVGFLPSEQRDGARFVTSEINWAEVSMKPIKDRDIALADLYEEQIFGGRLIKPVPVDRQVLRKSAEVRAWLGGKLPDAIHVATAIVSGCGHVVSADRRLRTPHGLERISFMELMQGRSTP